jgi:hypothetical protein
VRANAAFAITHSNAVLQRNHGKKNGHFNKYVIEAPMHAEVPHDMQRDCSECCTRRTRLLLLGSFPPWTPLRSLLAGVSLLHHSLDEYHAHMNAI